MLKVHVMRAGVWRAGTRALRQSTHDLSYSHQHARPVSTHRRRAWKNWLVQKAKRVTDLTKRVATELRARAAVLNMSRAEVCRRAGLGGTIGNDIFRGKRSPTLDELQAISRALGMTVTVHHHVLGEHQDLT